MKIAARDFILVDFADTRLSKKSSSGIMLGYLHLLFAEAYARISPGVSERFSEFCKIRARLCLAKNMTCLWNFNLLSSDFRLVSEHNREKIIIEFNPQIMKNSNEMNEKNLHQKFVRLGSNRRKLTNQLLALLPEIFEKQIYRKYAATIVEYAGKFGGLSAEVVKKRLRLEKHLKDKPKLRELIVSEGVHKIALVATLATVENESMWAYKVQNMSKTALQELSKEVRSKKCGDVAGAAGGRNLFGEVEVANLCKAVPAKIAFELNQEMTGKFLKLKKKFGGNLSDMEVMKKILEIAEATEERLIGRKRIIGKKMLSPSIKVSPGTLLKVKNVEVSRISRYIPQSVKNKIMANSHGLCTYPGCNRAGEVFHHKERFANNKSHESVVHLCKIHHEFVHNGLIGNEKSETQNWSLNLGEEKLQKIDQLYREYRLMSWSG